MQRTGRLVFFAAIAHMAESCIDLVSFPPNPPPRRFTFDTILLAWTPVTFATYDCLRGRLVADMDAFGETETYVSVGFCVLLHISISPSSGLGITTHAFVSR